MQVRIYDANNIPLDIRSFYLFVCQEPIPKDANTYKVTALALCDGNVLNEDFELYCSIVGTREKKRVWLFSVRKPVTQPFRVDQSGLKP